MNSTTKSQDRQALNEPRPTTGSGFAFSEAQDNLLPYDITVDRGTFTLQGQRYEYRRIAQDQPVGDPV